MTAGARPGFLKLYNDFRDRLQFVFVYVREAHPGENYPHHTSYDQKMRQARDWVELDKITVDRCCRRPGRIDAHGLRATAELRVPD